MTLTDDSHMAAALALAGRALGRTWPNPAVGCVLVRAEAGEERVVGRGWTQPGGRPHGETEALRRAGAAAWGATAYVTLEPCNHHGQTPPCAQALIDAGVARVVVALEDPDPRVSGAGIDRLRGAGIETLIGVGARHARELNAGFFLRLTEGRPLVTLKLATSLDGRIATRKGKSRWITGQEARHRVHLMRAETDAIMVGLGTVRADDPALTCRLPGLEDRSPIRVVMDSNLTLPADGRLLASARETPVWVVTREQGDPAHRDMLEQAGVKLLDVPVDGAGRTDIVAALRALGAVGITRLLVEGGGRLAASLLEANLVDRIAWFRAPCVIGGDGHAAVAPFGVEELDQATRFESVSVERCGPDLLETFRRRA